MEKDDPSLNLEAIGAELAKARAVRDEIAKGIRPPPVDSKKQADRISKQKEVRFSTSHILTVVFLLWFLIIHAIGIYFFTKGFLLTRLVLDSTSECSIPPIELAGHTSGEPARGCWHPKSFDKAVVIIVDALRYDFTVPFRPSGLNTQPHHFHDALPLFYETASKQPQNAFLRPFIADPPTATLQRLKGLTTGTLPTFVDAGSNFAGTAIEEDNLISQLRDAGKRIVHLGDDTWHALFPGYFEPNLTKAYDSFNVWDLHTVDNGVTEHIIPLLNPSNSGKWDVIIGHYLGVDHAGHRYGPDHPAMTSKLQQMDSIFRQIVDLIDDKTLLLVMGDHGMDAKGDHGGESDDEVEAALWMYSKRGIFGRGDSANILPPLTAKERPVAQIDLVPTLALLLGIPVPFNNLGTPIEEAFIGKSGADWENLAVVNRITSAQIKRYQHEYALARGLDESTTSGPLSLYSIAGQAYATATSTKMSKSTAWQTVYQSYLNYEQETLRTCRSLWARFDIPNMVQGIVTLIAGVVAIYMYSRMFRGDISILTPLFLIRVTVGGLLGGSVGTIVHFGFPESVKLLDSVLLGSAWFSLAAFIISPFLIGGRLGTPFTSSLWGWLAVLFTVSQSIGFASNSYTIWEDEILSFFITTFGILAFISSMRQEDIADKALGTYHSIILIALTRLASLSRLCREEQIPFCKSTYYASATSSTSAPWQLLIPFILPILLPDIMKSFYRGTKSYQGSAIFWIGIAFRIGLALSAIYWTLDVGDDAEWFNLSKGTLRTIKVILAQITLGLALAAGTSTYIWAKPCISIETAKKNPDANGKPTTTQSGSSHAVTILGFANVHGSRYYLLVVNFVLAIILLQKPMGGGAIGILAWQMLSLLEVIDTNNLSENAIAPVMFALLGSFYFFKTGHQATPSSIQWETAFIPLKTVQYPWSPILVVASSFGAQILTAIAVPLVAFWKKPPKKNGLLGDVARTMATHILYYAVINLATTMWAGWLRRHLMLYRIFNPRFLLGAIVLLVVDLVGILVAVAATRWNFLSVADIFGWP